MNYHHIYHAGNFADVFKHCVLIMLIASLFKKNTPVLFLDTHAGIGKYDLTTVFAQKTREYETGISRIYNLHDCPAVIQIYQHIVRTANAQTRTLRFYPGSPLIIRHFMRPQDQMILSELHPEDVQSLKYYFYQDKQVAVHSADGYLSLKAFLPPKHGRGLILIDPSFEEKNELEKIINGLKIAIQRFTNGIYMIWYPIKNSGEIENFHAQLKNIKCKNILITEFSIGKSVLNSGLTNCGIAIINTPWQFELELKPVISWLKNVL